MTPLFYPAGFDNGHGWGAGDFYGDCNGEGYGSGEYYSYGGDDAGFGYGDERGFDYSEGYGFGDGFNYGRECGFGFAFEFTYIGVNSGMSSGEGFIDTGNKIRSK